ncbi:MAG: outer membrane beta-barrel protein [Moraxellaceae bacterium]
MKKLTLLSAAVAFSAAEAGNAAVALDPQAFNLEPFRFIPTLEVAALQDSNIYRLSADEVSSFITVIKPTFDLVAQDRDNVYNLRYAAIAGFYGEDNNNYVDNLFSAKAHVEPTGRFRFDAGLGYNLLHDDLGTAFTEGFSKAALESRGSPDTYNLATLNGGVEYGAKDAAGQVALTLNYGQKRYDAEDAAAARDLDMIDGMLGFRLRVLPKTKALLDFEYNKGDYSNAIVSRVSDYTGSAYFLGVSWESTASTTGKIRLGSNKRDTADGDGVSGFAWDVGVIWTPLERSRFTLDGSRRLQDGTLPTISIDGRNLTAGWAHDWSGRVESKLTAGLGIEDHDRLPGTGIREDDSVTLGLVVNYQMRRWLVLGAGISKTNRESTMDIYDYDRAVFSLNGQLSL